MMNSLKSKLILIVLIPLIGLLFLSITISHDRYIIYTNLNMLNKVVQLSAKTKNLIYSLQKERGFSNGFLGSEGKSYKKEILNQNIQTSKEEKLFNSYLKTLNLSYYDEEFKLKINEAIKKLSKIEQLRSKTIELKIDAKELNSYYTTLIDDFIEIIVHISKISTAPELTQKLNAYSDFIYFLERTANERGLGTLVFSAKDISKETRIELLSLTLEQKIYLKNFLKTTDKKSMEYFKRTFKGKDIEESIRMRKDLLDSLENKSLLTDHSSYWFSTMTNKILLLQNISSFLNEDILQNSKILANNAKDHMIYYILLSIFILLIVAFIGRSIGTRIVNSVNELLDGIYRFFKFVNKESDDFKLIKINTEDEIATISKIINEKMLLSKKIIDEDIIKRAQELEKEVAEKTKDLEIRNKKYEILLNRFDNNVIATRTDLKGFITYVSDKFCEISGYSREELIGQNHNIVRHPDMPSSTYSNLWKSIQKGDNFIGEIKNKRKDGTTYWIKLLIVPEFDLDGNIVGYFSTKESIDDKIKIREFNTILEEEIKKAIEDNRKKDELLSLQSKLATMGEMIGIIAHQWKQPLSALSMRIQAIKFTKKVNEEYKDEFVKDNMQLIEFMTDTIDDFRNFFRNDKIKDDFSIKECIQKTIKILKPQLLRLEIDISIDGEDFIINGLQSEFQQVILNLINNAKDALIENEIEDKKIKILIDKNEIIVQDNAKGIPEDIIETIFDAYFTTKEVGKGTGIGLYLSKTIIEENMKGKISVENIEDGASFKIFLPKN